MKKLLIASVFALGLAACGGGGGNAAKTAILDSCLEEADADAETCNCMADQFVDKLDPKMLDLIVEASKAEDEDAYMMSKMAELEPAEMTQFMTVMMGAATECGMDMS